MTKTFLALALLASSALFSVTVVSPALAADASPAMATCAACHGKDGASTNKNMPIIGGQSSDYISNTLTDFKAGERGNCGDKKASPMCGIAKNLGSDDIEQIAKDYAGKPFVRAGQKADAALAQKGKEIAADTCEQCHAEGVVLKGQWMPYLKAQLNDFHTGKRAKPEQMVTKIQSLDQASIDALVQYYGSFK